MLTLLGCAGLLGILFYLGIRAKGTRRLLLIDSFLLGLIVFFIGSWLGAIQLANSDAGKTVLLTATMALVAAALSSRFHLRPLHRWERPLGWGAPAMRGWLVSAIAAFLILFNLGFSYVIFENLFGGSLESLFEPGRLLVTRKAIASGEHGHYFPGIVLQVRDICTPAFVFYLLAYSKPGKHRAYLVVIVLVTLMAIFFSGRRTPMLVLALVIIMGKREQARIAAGHSRIGHRQARLIAYGVPAVAVVAAVAGMGIINQLLGRAGIDNSTTGMLVESATNIFHRIVIAVPVSNIDVFEFVARRNYDPGALWLDSLGGLLPGTQAGLSNELHLQRGGSFQGNLVLGFPVSAYFNFGFPGVLLATVATVFFLAFLDRKYSQSYSPWLTSVRLVVLIYLPFAHNPAIFLLTGGLVLIASFAWILFFPPKSGPT